MSEGIKKNNREKGGLDTPRAIVIAACVISIGLGLGLAFSGSNGSNGSANVAQAPGGYPPAAAPTTAEDVVAQYIDLATKEHNVNKSELEACIENGEVEEFINGELAYARDQRGIGGTPNSVIVAPGGSQYISVPGFVRDYRVLAEIARMMIDEGSFIVPDGVETSFPEVEPLEIRPDDFVYGNPDAPVKIVEFSDFSCGFCGAFHPVMEQLVDENPDDIAWVYRHLPYQRLGFEKAVVAECVGRIDGNDAFWEYAHDAFQL